MQATCATRCQAIVCWARSDALLVGRGVGASAGVVWYTLASASLNGRASRVHLLMRNTGFGGRTSSQHGDADGISATSSLTGNAGRTVLTMWLAREGRGGSGCLPFEEPLPRRPLTRPSGRAPYPAADARPSMRRTGRAAGTSSCIAWPLRWRAWVSTSPCRCRAVPW